MQRLLFFFLFATLACNNANTNKVETAITEGEIEEIELTTEEIPERAVPAMSLQEEFTLEYLMGKFDPAKHPDFTLVDAKYADNGERYLRKDTYKAFQQMHAAALADGIKLEIISATRNFESQKSIWEGKWTGQRKTTGVEGNIAEVLPDAKDRALKILEYSSMPGSSRHHWGTDIDLNNLNNRYFDNGEGKKIYDWLRTHAREYGFCQPYSPKGKERPYGYNEERWHWSYLPVAQQLTKLAKNQLKDEMISGFAGAEAAQRIGIVEKYVLGINEACLQP